MKSPKFTRAQLDAMLRREQSQRAVRMAALSHELFTLASVLSPVGSAQGSDRAPAVERRQRAAAKRQRIHCALLLENGLIDKDGKPPGWTKEADIAEELMALSELTQMRRVS